ncbi:MAG: protein kinase [Deltaproteobacteria bacterium]
MGPTTDDSGVVPIGAMLDGRYRVDSVLGKGGMGRVYRGEHTGIGRAVAIKVLHADLGRNKEAAARFQREAIASGRLDHPNIVGVSDSGVLEDGCPYLVMEVLEGEELGKRLEREKRIPWPEAIEIMRGVLSGLRHAHERGVVHRDIKPDNVFLANKDGEVVVKLLDFGIAKLYQNSTDDPATTRAGLTVGTPAYLSPEQAVGGEIKPATDLYSASVVFYEMLAGRPPFEDTDPLSIMTAHVSREPPTFAEVAPDLELPPGLERVVRHGLEKVSAERIQTANEYMDALDAVLRAAGYAVMPRASGQVRIPTPAPGSITLPPNATPAPFARTAMSPTTRAGTSQTGSFTPMPFSAQSTTQVGDDEPLPRKWLVLVGVVVFAAILIAIVLKLSGKNAMAPAQPTKDDKHDDRRDREDKRDHDDDKRDKKDKHHGERAERPDSDHGEDKDDGPRPPPPSPIEATLDRDTAFKAALLDLQDGKTCTDRKAAIPKLVALGDPRAIEPLRRARYRMRGGVLGFGDSNTNGCLRTDADDAIKALGGTVR